MRHYTGTKLKTIREVSGYNQQNEFAKKLGIKPEYYSLLERGERPLPLKVAKRLHTVFGVSLAYLVDESGLEPMYRPSKELLMEQEYTETIANLTIKAEGLSLPIVKLLIREALKLTPYENQLSIDLTPPAKNKKHG